MKKLVLVIALALLGVAVLGTAQRIKPGAGNTLSSLAGPDVGGKIAYASGGAIWMYSAGDQHRLTIGPQDKQDKRDSMPAFSPDGSSIIYTRFDEGYSDLYTLDVNNPKSISAITNNKPDVEVGSVDAVGHNGYADLALWALYPNYSPDGTRIAYNTDINIEYPGLFLVNPDGSNKRRISLLDHSTQAIERTTWSPNGEKIAVANYVTAGAIGQIWVLNLSTGHWQDYTASKEGAFDPSWSPDGRWIAFTQRESGQSNIYVVPADSTAWTGQYPTPIKLTTDNNSRMPTWSPDGTKLAWIALKDSSFDINAADFSLNAGTGQPGLSNIQKLTDKANVDAPGGLSWGR